MTFAAEAGGPLGDQVEGDKTQATGVTGPGEGAPRPDEVTLLELAGREA